MKVTQNLRGAFFISSACLVAQSFAAGTISAQGFGRVANQPYSGGVRVINEMKQPIHTSETVKLGSVSVGGIRNSGVTQPAAVPQRIVSVNLMPLVMGAWQTARPQIIADAQAYLNEHDIGGGFRTSKNRLTLAEDGPMFVGWDGRGFTLRLLLAGNSLSTYLRTPTPLGEDFDPGLIVGFDVEVTMDIEVENNQLVARAARIQPKVGRPVGKNVTGALAVAANDLVKTLSGTDFVGRFVNQVNGRDFAFQAGVNRELAKLNPMLQTAAKGGAIMPGFDAARESITLTLRNAGPMPVVR